MGEVYNEWCTDGGGGTSQRLLFHHVGSIILPSPSPPIGLSVKYFNQRAGHMVENQIDKIVLGHRIKNFIMGLC
ncbi:MAG TPA: hypothetical protein VJ225_00110 [Nitrososphaeraceae archaeon]|nr:hypothetical protein [Nitrososphaeraceae archaeon]